MIKNNQAGFTVLELTMVTVIIAILATLFIANFRGFEHRSVLAGEAEQMASVIRQAQIWALTGQTINATRYNYGVHISKCASGSCTYYLFSDNEESGNKIYDNGEEVIGGTYTILKGAYVNAILPATLDQLDILFTAPFGEVYFNGAQTDEQAQIFLKHTVFSDQKTININRISGQISVQ